MTNQLISGESCQILELFFADVVFAWNENKDFHILESLHF